MSNIQRERYIWLFFLVSSILMLKIIIPTQVHTNQTQSNYGPEFFPNILTIAVIVISAISFLGTFLKKDKSQEDIGDENSADEGKIWIGILVFLIMVGYVYIMDVIHFIPASIVSMLLTMWLLSVRKWYLYLVMIAIIFLVNYIFENILYIQLP